MIEKTILVFCLCLWVNLYAPAYIPEDSLMRELDEVIENRDTYLQNKEARLAQLRGELLSASDDRERFECLNRLYNEYHPFNTDSAYNISLRQEKLARRIGDNVLLTNALMNKASIFGATGMYHESLGLIDSIHLDEVPEHLLPYYYHLKRTVFGRMADYAAFPADKRKYLHLTSLYRDSIIQVNDSSSLAHVITKADALNVEGNAGEAIRLLKSFMENNDLTEHEIAICAWTLSEAYALTGERRLQKRYLLISAISDLKSSVREYISLRQLALMLYEDGDLDRAYKFMTVAVDDAVKCNARQRIIELNNTYPMINGIYVETVRNQKKALERNMGLTAFLAMLLGVLLFYMRKQMRKIARARKEIELAYNKQNRLTKELKDSNEELKIANNAVAEISRLKEVYIGRYMDQCLAYIEKLDSYRKTLNKLFTSGKMEDLKRSLKSSSAVDHELKAFYEQFDTTFLELFPTFVEEFNALLQPGEAIIPKKEGTLNAELRIYALIRLGITDTDKIAKFLRYSVTTIYNYRTRVRNKARGDRNLLEVEILKIGREDQ